MNYSNNSLRLGSSSGKTPAHVSGETTLSLETGKRSTRSRRTGTVLRRALKSNIGFAAATAVLLATASFAHATTIGFLSDPGGTAWDRGQANTAYGLFDLFPLVMSGAPGAAVAPSMVFSNAPVQASSGSFSTAKLSQTLAATTTAQGVGIYKDAAVTPSFALADSDVYFAGGNSTSFTISGSVNFTLAGFTLQIKRPNSSGSLNGDFNPVVLSIDTGAFGIENFSSVSTTLTTGGGDTTSSGGTYAVTTWYWGNNDALAAAVANGEIPANSTFTVTLAKTGLQRLIDGFAIDAADVAPQAVPEPSCLIALLGGVGILVSRRNRLAKSR